MYYSFVSSITVNQDNIINYMEIKFQIANIHCIIEKTREFQKNVYFSFPDYAKAFDCVDHNELWTILKGWEYQIILPFLRNLYAVQ